MLYDINITLQTFIIHYYHHIVTKIVLNKRQLLIHMNNPVRIYPRHYKSAITSYGVILFVNTVNKGIKERKFLICQRRDTIQYVDFIRGRYSDRYLPNLVNFMTLDEKQRLLKYDFDVLWNDLWLNKSHKIYTEYYERAKSKYNSIKHLLHDYINNSNFTMSSSPWGFPKGKRNKNESEFTCAIREFKEEVRLKINVLKVYNNVFTETFTGTDKNIYSTIYYVCEAKNIVYPDNIYMINEIRNITVSEEIAAVKWVTLDEAKKYLRYPRYDLLRRVNEMLRVSTDYKFIHI